MSVLLTTDTHQAAWRYLLLFAEPGTDTFGMLQKLLDAVRDARLLLGAERFRGEIVAARLEASFDQTGVEFEKVFHLFLLDDARHCLLFRR